MTYDPLKYLERAVDDAREAAEDLDPVTVNLSAVYDVRRKVKELQAEVNEKTEAALKHQLVEEAF